MAQIRLTSGGGDGGLPLGFKLWIPGRPVIFTDGSATAGLGCSGAHGYLLGYVGENNLVIERGEGDYAYGGTTGRMESAAIWHAIEYHHARMSALRAQIENPLYTIDAATGRVALVPGQSPVMPPEFVLQPIVFCDSEYLVKTLESGGYIERWETNGFTKANGEGVANSDLMMALSRLRGLCPFMIVHVRSHLKLDDPFVGQLARKLSVSEAIARQVLYWNSVVDDNVSKTRKTEGRHTWPKTGEYKLPRELEMR